MARYVLLIDAEKCNGCYNCFMACKDEYAGNGHPPWSVPAPDGVQLLKMHCLEHGGNSKIKVDFFPSMCRQCTQPACAAGAPAGAVFRRENGIVCFDLERVKDRRALAAACPYDAVYWDEAAMLPHKCTLCVHMLENGERTTRCAESCPTGALVFGDLDDPQSEVSRLLALPENAAAAASGDCVRYLRLPQPFLAGEVVLEDSGDCGADVSVTLIRKDTGASAEVRTDLFGDFQFSGLCPGVTYKLEFRRTGYMTRNMDWKFNKSADLGTIMLSRVQG